MLVLNSFIYFLSYEFFFQKLKELIVIDNLIVNNEIIKKKAI